MAMQVSPLEQQNSLLSSTCVLVHTPFGKDGELITSVLDRAGIHAKRCPTLDEIHDSIAQCPGAVIVADEALNKQAVQEFASRLQAQPPWSDLPVIVMTSGGEADEASLYRLKLLEPLGNVTLLERPLRKVTLVSAVNTALRAREHQYEIRDYLEERKRSEEELRSREERWRFIANALPQFIWTSRPDGDTEFINRYWYDYTGLENNGVYDRSWAQVVHPDDLPLLNTVRSEAAASGREMPFEYRVKRASDGAWRWHMGILKPERNMAGFIYRWVGVGIDIHDRREAEAALRRANAAL